MTLFGIYGLLVKAENLVPIFYDKIMEELLKKQSVYSTEFEEEFEEEFDKNKELIEFDKNKELIELLSNRQYADFYESAEDNIFDTAVNEIGLNYILFDDDIVIGTKINQSNIWDILPSKKLINYIREAQWRVTDKTEEILKNIGLLTVEMRSLLQLTTIASQMKYKGNVSGLNIPTEMKEQLHRKVFTKDDLDFYIL